MKRPSKASLIASLQDYLKTNKKRRPKTLEKWEFDSEEAYFKYVGYKPRKKTVVPAPSKKVKEEVKTKPEPVSKKKVSSKAATILDYVIAFDCTGSMASYIADVRSRVKDMVHEILSSKGDVQLKIVSFGDYCDMPSKRVFEEAYQECELTSNANDLVNFVNNSKNTGGGDNDEFYELVMQKIRTETKWRKDSTKVIMLIGDAHPHEVGYRYGGTIYKVDWKEELKLCKEMGIQFDTLRITTRGREAEFYATLSRETNGVCIDYQKSKNLSHIIETATYARTDSAKYDDKVKFATRSGDSALLGAVKQFGKLMD